VKETGDRGCELLLRLGTVRESREKRASTVRSPYQATISEEERRSSVRYSDMKMRKTVRRQRSSLSITN
jgi:hypothetical protein